MTMELTLQAFTALAIAALIAWLELVTSKYPRTCFVFLRSSWALWLYPAIYGVVAFFCMLAFNSLTATGAIQIQSMWGNSAWGSAVMLGLSTKALLHIRLFTVTAGGEPFPFGTETFVQLFEPWLLRTIALDEFGAVREVVAPRAAKYSDVEDVKRLIKQNIPVSLPEAERKAFALDVDQARDSIVVMELYLRSFGKRNFDRVFPP